MQDNGRYEKLLIRKSWIKNLNIQQTLFNKRLKRVQVFDYNRNKRSTKLKWQFVSNSMYPRCKSSFHKHTCLCFDFGLCKSHLNK